MQYPEYAGISHEMASREASCLIERAAVTGAWIHIDLPERLSELRAIIMRRDRKAA